MADKVNLVFHNIVKSSLELSNQYDVTESFLFDLIEAILALLKSENIVLQVFFDDGHKTQIDYAKSISQKYGVPVYIGIITEYLDKNDFISREEIRSLVGHDRVKVVSHGVSHAALAVYRNNKVMPTIVSGEYRNMERGHSHQLTKEEVLFQLKESKISLEKLGVQVDSFVYPYGILNEDIMKIIKDGGLYRRAYSCEEGVESKGTLPLAIPRFLVNNTKSVNEICSLVGQLIGDKR